MAWDIQDYNVAEQLQKFADVFAPGGLWMGIWRRQGVRRWVDQLVIWNVHLNGETTRIIISTI